MPLIDLNGISKAYGEKCLLDRVNLTVKRDTRIGLIGCNGEGKSTLLKLMAGLVESDQGHITRRSELGISYLPQEPVFQPGQTVRDAVSEPFQALEALIQAYEALVACHTSDTDKKKVEQLHAELDGKNAWSYRTKVDKAISRFYLDPDWQVEDLSGGWKRRVSLAQALVSEPDLLLMDEPTNHLDIASIEWLEEFIASFAGSVVIISHDRYFLDAVTEEIIELDRGKVHHFFCGYADYLEKKAEMMMVEKRQHRKFDRLLAQEERWIRKGIKARRTRNEGRVRGLESLRDERSKRKLKGGDVALRVATGIKSGRLVIEAREVFFSYGDQPIVRNISFKIMSGDRIALIGPNGAGKTTLLKLLLGEIKPDEGQVRHGTRLEVAFLSQIRTLDEKQTVSDVLLPQGGNYVHVGGHEPRHIASYMQDFLFDSAYLRSPVSALSGGERGRLLLARLLLQPANMLVLDEPTNDLDIGTIAVLEKALSSYNGTILLVSHDRAFVDRVASRVVAFEENGQCQMIEGGYSDYQRWKERNQTSVIEKKEEKTDKASKKEKKSKKLSYIEQRDLDQLPIDIEQFEAEKSEIESRFCDPEYFSNTPEAFRKDQEDLHRLQEQLSTSYQRWEKLEQKKIDLQQE